MKSEQLDMSFEEFGHDFLIVMSGKFYVEQVPNVKEKIKFLISQGQRSYLIDLNNVIFVDGEVINFFRNLLNEVNGRGGKLILIYDNNHSSEFFKGYEHIFSKFRTLDDYKKSGFVEKLRRSGVSYSKRTGIRLNAGVAFLILILMSGWTLSLFSIISNQEVEIQTLDVKLVELEKEREVLLGEVTSLRNSIAPLVDMGMINDSLKRSSHEDISDWIEYLEVLENRKQKRAKAAIEKASGIR